MQRLAGVSRHNLLYTRRAAHSHAAAPTLLPLSRKRLANVTAAAVALTLGISYLAWPSPSRHAPTSASLPLALTRFTPVTIESSEDTGPSTKLITLMVPPKLLPSTHDHHLLRPIHSIYVKDDDMQVERPYTPLFGIESDGHIRLWVKRYEHGEVGRWLHAKKPGDVIEIRGPALTWDFARELKEGKWDDIIMISGGTGITPFFQLIHNYFKEGSPSPDSPPLHLTLLHSSPAPAHLPSSIMLSTLQSLASTPSSSFLLKLFFDRLDDTHPSAPSAFEKQEPPPLAVHRISKEDIYEVLVERGIVESPPPALSPSSSSSSSWWWPFFPPSKSKSGSGSHTSFALHPESRKRRVLFLVCGPEPMIHAIAGPRARDLTAGPVRGILGEMGFTSIDVRQF